MSDFIIGMTFVLIIILTASIISIALSLVNICETLIELKKMYRECDSCKEDKIISEFQKNESETTSGLSVIEMQKAVEIVREERMSEISGEEAIKVLSTYNCVDCACGSSLVPTTQCKWDCKYKSSVIKAISGMEKLKKIEQIIKEYDGAIIISDNMGIVSGQKIIDELKQIVKEVEE